MKKARKTSLNVKKVLDQFQEAEESTAHRKGTFKIDTSFDDALRTILKVKPAAKKSSK